MFCILHTLTIVILYTWHIQGSPLNSLLNLGLYMVNKINKYIYKQTFKWHWIIRQHPTLCKIYPLSICRRTGHQMKLMRKHIILELRFFIPNITNLRRHQHDICLHPHSDWSKWISHLIIFSLELVSLSHLYLIKRVFAKYFRNWNFY